MPPSNLPPGPLPDYRVDELPDLYLDQAQVDRCRALATEVFLKVYDFIARHSTVSIERTVLRLLGLSGAGSGGVPLCNLMVDRIKQGGGLEKGAAYWYGRALRSGASSPTQLVEAISLLQRGPELAAGEEQQVRDEVR